MTAFFDNSVQLYMWANFIFMIIGGGTLTTCIGMITL